MPKQWLFSKHLKCVSQNRKSSRTNFCFPRVFTTSKYAPLFVKCNFVTPAKSFFLWFETFCLIICSDNVPEVFFAHELIVSMEIRKICKFLKSVRKNSINCYSGLVENSFDNPATFFAKVGKNDDQTSKKLHSNGEKQIGILPRNFFFSLLIRAFKMQIKKTCQ